jgi:hypothetical protein
MTDNGYYVNKIPKGGVFGKILIGYLVDEGQDT